MRTTVIACGLALLAGCGGGSEKVPSVCIQDPAAIERALVAAPAAVPLDDGGVLISDCVAGAESGDQLQAVGTTMLATAQRLADRRDEGGLGYLIGAVRRGEKRNGAAGELVRRLQQEADSVRGSAAYRRGLRAGLAKG